MDQSDIKSIQKKLEIILPSYYINTMLNYPFPKDSFGEEFMLSKSNQLVLDCNGVFEKKDNCYAIGSDGGEYIYYIKLNGEEIVYIYDLEKSDFHNSIEASSWEDYLTNIQKIHQEIEEDKKQDFVRKIHKKWWQFWV